LKCFNDGFWSSNFLIGFHVKHLNTNGAFHDFGTKRFSRVAIAYLPYPYMLWRRVKAHGFVLYPGKISQTDTFRIGNIGEVSILTGVRLKRVGIHSIIYPC